MQSAVLSVCWSNTGCRVYRCCLVLVGLGGTLVVTVVLCGSLRAGFRLCLPSWLQGRGGLSCGRRLTFDAQHKWWLLAHAPWLRTGPVTGAAAVGRRHLTHTTCIGPAWLGGRACLGGCEV